MTEHFDRLYRGVSHAAWAYFFLYFDINLGNVSILPKFVCYLLLWNAIGLLEDEERDLSLLRPLCLLLGLWNGADWLLSWAGGSLDGLLYPLDLVVLAASLYFQFQIFTDFAHLAARYQPVGAGLDLRLLRLRTVQVLLITAMAATGPFSVTLGDTVVSWTFVALALTGLVTALMLMAGLFALRRCFAPERRFD